MATDQATNLRHHGFLIEAACFFTAPGIAVLAGAVVCGVTSGALYFVKRATRSFPGVDEGRTITEGPWARNAASTGVSCWISAAPRRSRLTTASAVSSSKAIQRTIGNSLG